MSPNQWAIVVAAAAVFIVAAATTGDSWSRPRRRLGVSASARLARRADLRTLAARRSRLSGRFVLGRWHHTLLATEATTSRRRTNRRPPARTSVAIVGPTRCGKTAAAVSGILEWDGPAILSSVKTDLMNATIGWRRTLGDVRVFDPTDSTGTPTAGWSPLRGATTITGAQQAARALIDTGPRSGVDDVDFFTRLAEQLLWPLLYLAATNGATMRDVIRWTQHQTSPEEPGTDLAHYTRTVTDRGRDACHALYGIWALDRRTRASAYATAQTVLGAWTDPGVADASDYEDIDLTWLLDGTNTLYICAPLHHQQRLAPVFGGLLGDLINQAYERVNRTNEALRPTLIVLDEAANTPTRWLPHVASTCAGIGLLLVTVWQSKAQLDAAYGTLADSVLTNHATKLIFSGASDLPTLDYVARLLGDEEIPRHSTTRDRHHQPSVTTATGQTVMLPAHVLRQAAPGRALLIHNTLPPAHVRSHPYYRDRRLITRARTM